MTNPRERLIEKITLMTVNKTTKGMQDIESLDELPSFSKEKWLAVTEAILDLLNIEVVDNESEVKVGDCFVARQLTTHFRVVSKDFYIESKKHGAIDSGMFLLSDFKEQNKCSRLADICKEDCYITSRNGKQVINVDEVKG